METLARLIKMSAQSILPMNTRRNITNYRLDLDTPTGVVGLPLLKKTTISPPSAHTVGPMMFAARQGGPKLQQGRWLSSSADFTLRTRPFLLDQRHSALQMQPQQISHQTSPPTCSLAESIARGSNLSDEKQPQQALPISSPANSLTESMGSSSSSSEASADLNETVNNASAFTRQVLSIDKGVQPQQRGGSVALAWAASATGGATTATGSGAGAAVSPEKAAALALQPSYGHWAAHTR